ncbi:MAG: TatD family hydrolase [Bacteroidaceae bacterium]|nr:TatD family hydrolase [Bacteroidaceae bacterium]
MPRYLNIHTHCPLPADEYSVVSFGLHPWQVGDDWQQQLAGIAFPERDSDASWLVGECGLDRLYPAFQLQLAAFEAQIDISESYSRPMIIHCVKAWDDLIRLHRRATQPWIIHGFRGNPQQLVQLLAQGFYVSFGFRYNQQALQTCPLDRLFLETDDTPSPIAPLYAEVAALRGITVEALIEHIAANSSFMRS